MSNKSPAPKFCPPGLTPVTTAARKDPLTVITFISDNRPGLTSQDDFHPLADPPLYDHIVQMLITSQ